MFIFVRLQFHAAYLCIIQGLFKYIEDFHLQVQSYLKSQSRCFMVPQGMLKTFGSVVLYLPLIHALFSIKITVHTCWLSPEKIPRKYLFRVSYCYIDLVESQGSLIFQKQTSLNYFTYILVDVPFLIPVKRNPYIRKVFVHLLFILDRTLVHLRNRKSSRSILQNER